MMTLTAKRNVAVMLVISILIMTMTIFSVAATPEADSATATESQSEATAGDGVLFDGEPDNTGNSAGEIIFMLVIVLGCLFFVVEAIVSRIKKRSKT